MAKFLIEASYTAEGLKGLVKDGGSGRRAAFEAAVKGLGGKLEAMYFALGEHDTVSLLDLPDNVSVAALALAVNVSGMLQTRTTPLMTAQEVDEVVRKTVKYRAPGAPGA